MDAVGIYNLASGTETTINEVAQTLREITDYQVETVYGPEILGETRRIYLNASRAGVALGWEPTVSLREGLERTVTYFKEVELI
jgi:UDP-glucose 4-epimerase